MNNYIFKISTLVKIELDYSYVKDNLIKLDISHFSPYIVYNETTIDDEIIMDSKTENPKTYDGVRQNIFIGSISLIGLISLSCYLIRMNKVKKSRN